MRDTMEILKLLSVIPISMIVLHLFRRDRVPAGAKLPPGPKGYPIIGNMLDMHGPGAKDAFFKRYSRWAKQYGEIFTFNVFGTRTVVLNSYKAITELLEQRSYNYSDRARQPMMRELLRSEWNIGLMRYSDRWRSHRRVFHQYFQPRMVPDYYDVQRKRTITLIKNLISNPQDFPTHVKQHGGGIILEITYGYNVLDNQDPYLDLAEKAVGGVRDTGLPGQFLVDYIPTLMMVPSWFPGAGFMKKAAKWADYGDQLLFGSWQDMKKQINDGTAIPSFVTNTLEKHNVPVATLGDNGGMDDVIRNCAGMAFVAGADTTVSSVLTFMLGMSMNQEIQIRAQKEMDEVIGSDRLPDFEDRENLPICNAIFWEATRWGPVVPLAVAHASINDDVYEGTFIPGGSIVVPNIWAVFHDESLFGPNVNDFNPDRFLNKTEGKDMPPNPEFIAFGFGRRICPGRHLAINSVWLAIAYLIQNFTIKKALDANGKEIDPVVDYTDGSIIHPFPFGCRFIPRKGASPLV